jgi:biotin transport system substrate-specific component
MATSLAKPHSLIAPLLPESAAGRAAAYLILAVVGSLVLWASAKVQVPFYPVPMTLQTLAIMVIAASYGWRLALATIVVYFVEGAAGLPVFSGTPERGIGLAYMLGPTGGYLLGFAVAMVLVGWVSERGAQRSPLRLLAAMLVADAIVLALGFAWLARAAGAEVAWTAGVVPFLLGVAIKIVIAALLVPAAGGLLGRRT